MAKVKFTARYIVEEDFEVDLQEYWSQSPTLDEIRMIEHKILSELRDEYFTKEGANRVYEISGVDYVIT